MGHVYILKNKSMPGMVKIGYTNGSVRKRSEQLSGSTGVPIPFEIAYKWDCEDAYYVEQILHKKFKQYRINDNREFFSDDCVEHVAEYMNSKVAQKANYQNKDKLYPQKLLLRDIEVPNTGLVVLSMFSRKIPILGILLIPFWGVMLLKELFGHGGDLGRTNRSEEISIARIAYLLTLIVIIITVLASLNVMISLLTSL